MTQPANLLPNMSSRSWLMELMSDYDFTIPNVAFELLAQALTAPASAEPVAPGLHFVTMRISTLPNGHRQCDLEWLCGEDAPYAWWSLPDGPHLVYTSSQPSAKPAGAVEPAESFTPNPERCANDVFEHGVSLGMFDMKKDEAEAYCIAETKRTGRKHDWHFVGGRVHIMALAPTTPAATAGLTDAEKDECIRQWQKAATASAERVIELEAEIRRFAQPPNDEDANWSRDELAALATTAAPVKAGAHTLPEPDYTAMCQGSRVGYYHQNTVLAIIDQMEAAQARPVDAPTDAERLDFLGDACGDLCRDDEGGWYAMGWGDAKAMPSLRELIDYHMRATPADGGGINE